MSITRIHQGVRYHDAIVHQGVVWCSGMTATDCGTDIVSQSEGVFKKIDALLAECGSDKDHMLHAQIFLKNVADVAAFNQAWDAWIHPETSPSRDLSVTTLGRDAILVEIIVTAAIID